MESLEEEYELIKLKTSKLSRSKRDAIVAHFEEPPKKKEENTSKPSMRRRHYKDSVGNNRNKAQIKDSSGKPINKSGYNPREVDSKVFMRDMAIMGACDPLSIEDIKQAIADKEIPYNETIEDENGTPMAGEIKILKLSNIDISRAKIALRNKQRSL